MDDAAATVLRLAVLLQAGIAPPQAWRHLAAVDAVAAAIGSDGDLATALRARDGVWPQIATAWDVATAVGAPLAAALRAIAEALRDAAAARDDARAALAEPAATARLMLWLPPCALLLGTALGFDTVPTLLGSPAGWACLATGITLLIVARWWTTRLVRAAQPPGGIPGLHAELVAIALSGGASIERAETLVADAGVQTEASTAQVLVLSRAAGVPAVELLRASAAQLRQDARTAARLRAARLGSRLIVPLGVCTLPAFVLLGVAPLLLGVLSTTSLPL